MKTYAIASASLLLLAINLSPARAQIAYTTNALNGCYAHLNTSVVTQSGTNDQNGVGVLCFDGNGNVMGTSSQTNGLSGIVSSIGGKVRTTYNQTGTYTVTNLPGAGMGTIDGPCNTHEFALKDIDSNGLAHGYSFILIRARKQKGCPNDAIVSGGTAEYQGPLQ